MAEKTGALTYDEIYKKLEELDDDLFISGSDPGAESEGNMIFDEGLRKSLGEARFHNMTFLLPIDTKELLNLSPEKLSYMIVLMNKIKKESGHFLLENLSNLDFKIRLADDLLSHKLHESREIEDAEVEAKMEAEASVHSKDVREELIEKINSFSTDRLMEILDSVENSD